MRYIKNILFLALSIIFLHVQGQYIIGSNLVNNPSFEEYYQCPFSVNQLVFSKYWWGYSAEYCNSCSSIGCGVPSNGYGSQYAKTGDAYASFAVYGSVAFPQNNDSTLIESIKDSLKDSLKKQKRYCVDYYISLTDYSVKYAGLYNNGIILYDSIGAMFSENHLTDNWNPVICDICPKFSKSVSGIDTLNWLKISGSIIANGGEKYLTIGKFHKINWPADFYCRLGIYLDDVSVCECSFDINLGPDTSLCESETILLSPNLPNATYTWQDSSHAASYEVKQPGTYWVRAYVAEYDITSTDTIVITGGDDSFCNPPLTIPNVITPNGDSQNDNFVIQNTETYEIALQIYNRWGNLIYETTNYQNDFSCNNCADGVYFYVLKAKSKRNGREKEYKGSLTVIK